MGDFAGLNILYKNAKGKYSLQQLKKILIVWMTKMMIEINRMTKMIIERMMIEKMMIEMLMIEILMTEMLMIEMLMIEMIIIEIIR